ncbi:hypothetical protein CP8484711_1372C, partial [Chlamydia psittaci 84-8471/1]
RLTHHIYPKPITMH